MAVIDGNEKNFLENLACEVRVIVEVKKSTDVTCGNFEGEFTEFGYTNPIKNESYVLGQACYATGEGRVIFVHMKLPGITSLENHVQLSRKENLEYFRDDHLINNYKIDLLKAANWKQLGPRLAGQLGSNYPVLKIGRYLGVDALPNKQFLSISKLPWNYVTIYGGDSLPNFKSLQVDIKNLNVPSYDLYIGNRENLTLSDTKNNTVPIYLEEGNKYPVPKFIWLVVITEGKAAAFIISNNLNASENEITEITAAKVCSSSSKCSEMSWLKTLLADNAYRNTAKGYVVCCPLNDFQFTEMPDMGKKDLLDKI